MGGAMHAGAGAGVNTLNTAKAIPKVVGKGFDKISENSTNNKQVKAGEFSTDEDIELVRANLDVEVKDKDYDIKTSQNAKKALDEAESFEDLQKSTNKEVRTLASVFEKSAEKPVTFGDKTHRKEVAKRVFDLTEKWGSEIIEGFKKRGLDTEGKSLEEIQKQVDNMDIDALEAMTQVNPKEFSTSTAVEENAKNLRKKNFDKFKAAAHGVLDTKIEIANTAKDALNKGKKSLILLDDPFHSFDDKRREKTKQVLNDLTSKFQVVLFTHSSDYDDWGNVIEI